MPRDLFLFSSPDSVLEWTAIDDRVMGGVSTSSMRHDPQGYAIFEGMVSLQNNGGFASVRAPAKDLGAPRANAYVLDVNGDGKRYKINLRTDDAFDGINYQAAFVAPAGVWTQIRLVLSQFAPTWRGRPVPDAPALDPGKVRQVGLMVADRQVGAFALAIRAFAVE